MYLPPLENHGYSGQLGDGVNVQYYETNRLELIVIGTPGYNTLVGQISSNGAVVLSHIGLDGTNYALDRSTTIRSPAWVPQATNTAGAGGGAGIHQHPQPVHEQLLARAFRAAEPG